MSINSVIHTNEHSIDRVLNAGIPVVLVFWDGSDRTTTQMDEDLDQLAKAYAGKALIVKIDAKEEKALANRYDVRQLPTIVYIKNGEVVDRSLGNVGAATLRTWLEYLTSGAPRPQPVPAGREAAGAKGASANQARNGGPVTLTDANFAEVVGGDKPILVDFWAEWCGPCRMVAPSVEQLAKEFAGRAVVAKLNVDENPITSQRFNVMSIPTLLIFKNGEVVDQIVGAQPLPVLRQQLSAQV